MGTFPLLIGKIIKHNIMTEKIMFGTIFLNSLPTLKEEVYNSKNVYLSGWTLKDVNPLGWKDIIWLNQKTPHKYSVLTA